MRTRSKGLGDPRNRLKTWFRQVACIISKYSLSQLQKICKTLSTAAEVVEEKEEPTKKESDEDMGFGLLTSKHILSISDGTNALKSIINTHSELLKNLVTEINRI